MENKANSPKDVLFALSEIMEKRKTANPDESYVAKLFNEGVDAILKKVSEEADGSGDGEGEGGAESKEDASGN